MGAAITQLLPRVGVTRRGGGVLLPMGQARWVVTGRAGLCLCGGTARERAGVGVAPVLRGTPAITQLLHLVGVTPQLAGLVLPTGWAQWVVPARAGLCLCGSPTRERACLGVGPGPRGTPVTTQLLHLDGGDPPLGRHAPTHRPGSVSSH